MLMFSIRYLVLEYILATDLKQHFDIIMQFNERVPDMVCFPIFSLFVLLFTVPF